MKLIYKQVIMKKFQIHSYYNYWMIERADMEGRDVPLFIEKYCKIFSSEKKI